MAMTKPVLLEMRGVRIEGRTRDDWLPIIEGADLTLHRGEVLGLIGESGAGKSTLGLAAMGYVRDGCRFAGGTVTFDGVELTGAPEATRRALRGKRIAYVAQSAAASFNPAHRLIDQYAEAPVWHGVMGRAEAEHDAVELYRRMQLPAPEQIGWRYPHQVSGGQLQRAMTAMAMACRPELIIFDEPTTALDVTTQIEVLAAIRDIVAQFDTAAIYITHDLAVVAQMADRIKVLLRGREVEEAETRSMLTRPSAEYTRTLWAVRSLARETQPPPAAAPVLSIEGVTAGYGKAAVLHDVSLDLYPRRTLAVVGESGSGKSTVARVMTGLLPPSAGTVAFEGRPLAPDYRRRSREELRQMQMIYQMADTALNPKLTLREIIGRPAAMYLGLRGRALTARIRDLLALIEMGPDAYIDRRPGELSGGQKQRVGIARALAAEPRVIICDEVTSALDQIVQEGILRLLNRLQAEFDLAYMFITHDLATVRAIADEVAVMQHGRVVDAGPRDAIFAPPHAPYTELLLSSVPEMDPDWLTGLLARRATG
jgi:peptide/nickel transport system ATP-binding protein